MELHGYPIGNMAKIPAKQDSFCDLQGLTVSWNEFCGERMGRPTVHKVAGALALDRSFSSVFSRSKELIHQKEINERLRLRTQKALPKETLIRLCL